MLLGEQVTQSDVNQALLMADGDVIALCIALPAKYSSIEPTQLTSDYAARESSDRKKKGI